MCDKSVNKLYRHSFNTEGLISIKFFHVELGFLTVIPYFQMTMSVD